MLGDRGSTLDLLARALLRGALVGAALAPIGVVTHALLFGLTLASALGEVAFDLALGLFVVAPAAFLEGLSRDREPPALPAVVALVLTLPLAALGAAVAFLQSQYASAVLRTGSLDAGLAEVAQGAQALALVKDLQGLFVAIGVVVTVHAWRRLSRERSPLGRLGWSVTIVACLALLRGTGLTGPPLKLSLMMLVALATLLPILSPIADALAERARARRERSG